ncbi:hypothetical protein [Nocardia rhamnosiphila]|uniref:hypothetical protein n=1 Tax=Nocardia rhamnosiphila TaxID=426716 RepID=UPI0007C6645A|nr:hypothetical protein [Nocardia rhamnosiphila]
MSDYRIQHKAPGRDNGVPLPELDRAIPDVYDRPQDHHGGDDAELMTAVRAARGNFDRIVRIYRSVPAGVEAITRATG